MSSEGAIRFEVHFLLPHMPLEVKEFSIEQNLLTGFSYFNQELINKHPGIEGREFSVYWKDDEGNPIGISSDNELRNALAELPVIKIIYVHVKSRRYVLNKAQYTSTCHECRSKITEIYLCKTCGTNLCFNCKYNATHEHHTVIRIKKRNPVWRRFPNNLLVRIASDSTVPKMHSIIFCLAKPPGVEIDVDIEEERAKIITALGELFGFTNPDWLKDLAAARGINGAYQEIERLFSSI